MTTRAGGDTIPEWLRDCVESAVGNAAISWRRPDCGLSAALRYTVHFADGSAAFVKAATDEQTESWLRTEHLVLSSIAEGRTPRVLAWLDQQDTRPILLTEDLSNAYWPASHQGVTWRPGDIDSLFAGIDVVSTTAAPLELAPYTIATTVTWSEIGHRAVELEALSVCSEAWLRHALPVLAGAQAGLNLTGDALIHGDIRSDNACLVGNRAVFVDWSHAARGNPAINRASVLTTLNLEGGPPPYELMPDGGGWAAHDAANLIGRLLDDQSMAPWLRRVLLRLIAISLDWAARSLRLPPVARP